MEKRESPQCIRFDEPTRARLQNLSEKTGRSFSWLVKALVRDGLNDFETAIAKGQERQNGFEKSDRAA